MAPSGRSHKRNSPIRIARRPKGAKALASARARSGASPPTKRRRLLDVIAASVEGARSLEEIALTCLKALFERTGATAGTIYDLE
ncbi:MAG: hypothetical protein ACREI3_02110, partial [Nitrospirales bacterium]